MNNTHLVVTVFNERNKVKDSVRVQLDNSPVDKISYWGKGIFERDGFNSLPSLYYMNWDKVIEEINNIPHSIISSGDGSTIGWEVGLIWPNGVNDDGSLSANRNIKFYPTTWPEVMSTTNDNFLEVEGFILVDKTGSVYEYGIIRERNFINLGGFDFLSSDYKAYAYHRREGVITLIEKVNIDTLN